MFFLFVLKELTGILSKEFPLKPGEKAPNVRRRIGAAFKLDDLSILQQGSVTTFNYCVVLLVRNPFLYPFPFHSSHPSKFYNAPLWPQ